MRREIICSPATNVVTEAKTLADFLIEWEQGQGTHDVENALHRAASRWGLDGSSLKTLRYRWRDLQDVKASLLERLREAYETIYERQRRQAEFDHHIEMTLSRGSAGGAQDGEVCHFAASPQSPSTQDRITVSQADDLPAKQRQVSDAELQLEKEH